MCGLAGVLDLHDSTLPEVRLRAAADALTHRGPDARHVWKGEFCTLLHCRLRILDISERSDQPMERGRVVMVYNGEIYNFRALRADLETTGWQFSTTSDAEVFLAGFCAWGTDVFRRARGMWAAAFWEPVVRRLTLARDPLGKKPLVFAAGPERVAFASNTGALLALQDQTPEVDQAALACYLGHLCVPQEHSVFMGVEKVPPGTAITWTAATNREETRYWSVPTAPREDLSGADVVDETERLLRQSVRRRLESDVPLGVFLSAGYDSGLVAALASQEGGGSLVAVTAGTTGSGYDERQAASLIAQQYGLRHRPLEVAPLSAASLPMLIAEIGEPFGDSSLLPSFEVARAARQEITVALTGDGGDEGFFGYETFRGVWLAQRYRRFVPAAVREWLWNANHAHRRDDWRRRVEAVFEYGRFPIAEAFRNRMGFSPDERNLLLGGPPIVPIHEAEHIYASRLRRFAPLPDADALRRTFFETYLPNDYLTKVDTATMAASLEARCPFLDIDLVEFLLGLPESVAFARGRLKGLLRPVAQRHLPAEIITRRKSGFGVPVDRWIRSQLQGAFEEFVLRAGTPMADLVSTGVVRQLIASHRAGADHGTRLWGLLALGVWFAVVVERRWPADAPLPLDN